MKVNKTLTLALSFLGEEVSLEFDQPIGSSYSKFKIDSYPVNYGFVPNTIAGDGMELDAYFLGTDQPLKNATGKCIAIIHRLDEEDDKLIVVPRGLNLNEEEIAEMTHFQEKRFRSVIIKLTDNFTPFSLN